MRRLAAGLAALTAWVALGLQFSLTAKLMAGDGLSAAIWRYLGFFTILTNLGVAIVASCMVLKPAWAGARVRLATAASIAFVGVVYSVKLRATWSPTGWQAVADHALHDATPVLFLIVWALAEHGALKWRDALWAMAPPAAYCGYALIRGAADGWYAYWFLDPGKLSVVQMAGSIVLLLAAFLAIATTLIAADRWLARRALS
jgi:hypothetical protein